MNQLEILLNFQFTITLGNKSNRPTTVNDLTEMEYGNTAWHNFHTTIRQKHIFSVIQCENVSWPDGPVISETDWPSYIFTGQRASA